MSKYNTFIKRFIALVIDNAIFSPLIFLDIRLMSQDRLEIGIMAWGTIYSIVVPFYYIYLHSYSGQTVGKMITGLKVIKEKNNKLLSFKEAFIREFPFIIFSLSNVYSYYYLSYVYSSSNMPEYSLSIFGKIYNSENITLLIIQILYLVWIGIEIIVILTNKKRKAVHDYMVQSVVVRI